MWMLSTKDIKEISNIITETEETNETITKMIWEICVLSESTIKDNS